MRASSSSSSSIVPRERIPDIIGIETSLSVSDVKVIISMSSKVSGMVESEIGKELSLLAWSSCPASGIFGELSSGKEGSSGNSTHGSAGRISDPPRITSE